MLIWVGERWDFRPILDEQLANCIMPDIVRCGGISEMRKIAVMGEARCNSIGRFVRAQTSTSEI